MEAHAEMQFGEQKSLKAVGKALLGKRSQTAVQVSNRTQHTCGGPLTIAIQCLSKENGVCTSAQMWLPPEDCTVSQGSSGAEVSLRELTMLLTAGQDLPLSRGAQWYPSNYQKRVLKRVS